MDHKRTQTEAGAGAGAGVEGEDHASLFTTHRRLLLGVAYRMLGSRMDAEDVTQETFLQFREIPLAEIGNPRALLVTIVTRRAMDELARARVKREVYPGPWLPEPVVAEDFQDPSLAMELAESLSTALLLVLESLAPPERAAFILRDVFDFDYAELARILDKSESTCRKLVSRARERVRAERSRRETAGAGDVGKSPRFVSDPGRSRLLIDEFLRACRVGELDGLVGILAGDAVVYSDGGGRVNAARNPIFGALNSARFFLGVIRKSEFSMIPVVTELNGSPALAIFIGRRLYSVNCFDIDHGERGIRNIYSIVNPDKLQGLARRIKPPSPTRRALAALVRLVRLLHLARRRRA